MIRTRFFVPIALGLGIAHVLSAAPVSGGGDSAVDHFLRLQIRIYPSLPVGSVIICKAHFEDSAARSSWGEAIAAARVVGGAPSQCAMKVPLRWVASPLGEEAILSYQIEAEEPLGVIPKMIATGTTPLRSIPTGSVDVGLTMQVNPAQ